MGKRGKWILFILLFSVPLLAAALEAAETPAVEKIESSIWGKKGKTLENNVSTETAKPGEKVIEKEKIIYRTRKSFMGIGVNYPGVHVRLWRFDAKYQTSEKYVLTGLRFHTNGLIYTGIELDNVTKDTVTTQQGGIYAGINIGLWAFIVSTDIGFYRAQDYNVEVEGGIRSPGSKVIVNVAITYCIL